MLRPITFAADIPRDKPLMILGKGKHYKLARQYLPSAEPFNPAKLLLNPGKYNILIATPLRPWAMRMLRPFKVANIYDWNTAIDFTLRHPDRKDYYSVLDHKPVTPFEAYQPKISCAKDVVLRMEKTGKNYSEQFIVNVGCRDGITGDPCYALHLQGWKGIGMDALPPDDPECIRARENLEHLGVTLVQGVMVAPNNILEILKTHNCPKQFGMLKIDIDSHDFQILKPIMEAGYKPDIIEIEVNPDIPAPIKFAQHAYYQDTQRVPRFDEISPDYPHAIYGCSLAIVDELLAPKGYALVGCNFGYPSSPRGMRDAIYVRREYLADLGLEAIAYQAALDREPCPFSHCWADNKIDIQKWRNHPDPASLVDEIRDIFTSLSLKKYAGKRLDFDLYI